MAALVPLSGAVIRHAEYFFDPALSFAQGWNQIYSSAVGLPAEIVATAVLMEFWVNVNNAGVLQALFILACLITDFLLVWITVFGLFDQFQGSCSAAYLQK